LTLIGFEGAEKEERSREVNNECKNKQRQKMRKPERNRAERMKVQSAAMQKHE
jgi:hypothetical protein